MKPRRHFADLVGSIGSPRGAILNVTAAHLCRHGNHASSELGSTRVVSTASSSRETFYSHSQKPKNAAESSETRPFGNLRKLSGAIRTLLWVIGSLALSGPIPTTAQTSNTFTTTFSFPGSYNVSLPRVSPCCWWNWAITPLQVNNSLPQGTILITNISVTASATDLGQPIGGVGFTVLVGRKDQNAFALPTAGQIFINSPHYGGDQFFSAPVAFQFAEGGLPTGTSTTINGSVDFTTGQKSTPCCSLADFKQAYSNPFNTIQRGLSLQVFVYTGDPRTNLNISGITVTITGTVLPPAFSVSQNAINFPSQAAGGTSSLVAETFTNTSSSTITIGTFVITGLDAPSFTGSVSDCYERTMPPNDSCTIDLAFSPARTGAHHASLVLNDLTDAQLQVPLSGNAVGTPPSNLPPTYNVSIVGEPWPVGAQRVDFSALNNHGDMAGWLSFEDSSCLDPYGNPATYSHAFLYGSGSFSDLGTLPNAFVANQPSCYPPSSIPPDKHISGIGVLNDSGVLVGTADGSNGQTRAFIYTGGRIHDIQELVTDGTVLPDNILGIAINRIDQVLLNIGAICSSWIFDSGKIYPLQFPTNLPPCSNDDIVGSWPSRSLEINRPYPSGVAVPNDDGRSAVDIKLPSTFPITTAAIFQSGLFTDLGIPGGASSINSAGQVVGSASNDFNNEPFYWDRTSGRHSLTSLVPSGWTITGGGPLRAVINDAAQILTAGHDPDGKFHYVLLSPVVSTPSGTNVNVQSGGTTLTFSNVSSSGTTSVTPIDPATIGQVPGGFGVSGSVAYTISTTATFSGPVTLAFKVPGPISQTDFNNLSVLHNDPVLGLVDVTASSPPRDYANLLIHATTNSFSPFYLAKRGNHILTLFNQKAIYKGGSTIPVKLQVFDPNNQNISSPNLQVQARTLRLLSSNVSGPLASSGNANPDNNFRFDSTIGTGGGYIYNLSTKGLAQGVYSLSLYVGTDHTFLYVVTFEIK
jgi:probable HAF family extracellular repeat protein